MLSDFTPSATVAVKNLKAARSFYEDILGFEPKHFDDMVKALDAKGVPFEHYAMPGIMLQGHVHVVHEGSPSRVAWFKDPDGNLHNLNNGSPAPTA
jgi:hypothetical protein